MAILKKHQRKIEAGRERGYGHYHFTVTYPSGKEKTVRHVANAPLFDAITDLETNIVSVNHSLYKSISYLLNN